MNYHIELFHSLLQDFLQGEAALLTLDGELLGLRGQESVSFGTLATAATTATKYLNLQEGDIAILNDPYSGGSILSDMTFVMAVSEDLIWVRRKSLGRTVKIAKSVEEEGLRIPPTPIKQKNELNEVILSAIGSHPACPANFDQWVREECRDLTQKAKRLIEAVELSGFTITGELLESYLELSKQTAQQRIGERSSGETRVDVVLDSGELLRVNMEIQDGKVRLDFGGTTGAKTLSLTESATFGVCFHIISRFYGFEHLANSGSSSVLQITKPSGCWLNAKYPAATYKGMTCGVAALKTALQMALAQIHFKGEQALSSHCSLQFDLKQGDQIVHLSLPGGKGASASRHGRNARTHAFSIENLESQFPVKIQTVQRRPSNSEIKNKLQGGQGMQVRIEVQGDLEASWMTDLTLHKPRISKNCSHGEAGTISWQSEGEIKTLPVLGQQKFSAGDIIILSSGSGGGYGKE